jgi:urate oxidase/2-oxo-4-hydroxy-4-carboxy-5-ureidoimidazoline decarboxylase
MSAAVGARLSLSELNELDRAAFSARLGRLFENSDWVAEEAWERRPFASVAALAATLSEVVATASRQRAVELLEAHPELGVATVEALAARSSAAASEQGSLGLSRLLPEERRRLLDGQREYRERFGFPYVVCVRDHDLGSLLEELARRLGGEREAELRAGLGQATRIAELRLGDAILDPTTESEMDMTVTAARPGVSYEISYGKAGVNVYRQYARPLEGLAPLPESAFEGRPNALFANEISVEVFGDNFLASYTEGDNSDVVATDSMKNFILREGRSYEGATLEGYLAHLGRGFLDRYPQMEALRLTGVELPFDPIPLASGGDSATVHARGRGDRSTAELTLGRDGERIRVEGLRGGRVGMDLLKTKGSAFTRFVRDEYTTLPERSDRPLFVGLDVHWDYADPEPASDGIELSGYVAGEQVRDICGSVSDELVSESIQHLVHMIACRLLDRFPALASVELVGRNLTRDPFAIGEDPDDDAKVYCDPFPAAGTISLKMSRDA